MENLSIEKLKIQKEKIGDLKNNINQELKKMTTLEENDLTLIARFNRALDNSINSKWIGYDLTELYLNDVRKMKKDSAILVVAYTLLVDIFKDELLSKPKKFKDTISSLMINSFLPYQKYEIVGKAMNNDYIINAILDSDKDSGMLSHYLDDAVSDVEENTSLNLLTQQISSELQLILKNEQEPISNTILEESDYEIMKMYYVLKENADHVFDLTDDALSETTYDSLEKIKKYRYYSNDAKKRLYEIIKKIDNNDINYFKKFSTILAAIDIFDDVESKEKIVEAGFKHKK